MGYVMAMGNCIACNRVIAFNPNKVPSVRVKGKREPVCRQCIERANPQRKAQGMDEFVIHPDAYEPMSEEEL